MQCTYGPTIPSTGPLHRCALCRPVTLHVRAKMLPPQDDIDARAPLWDHMQMFWMDTDPQYEIAATALACAESKYTIDELKRIFLNEVRPAVSFNLYAGPAPEWTGFELKWLKERILKTHRFQRPLPWKVFHPYAYNWWNKLEAEIVLRRANAAIS